MDGITGHLSGLAAEDAVERHYRGTGRPIAARRWRSPAGEIDLIAREGDTVIFVEVKRARSHAQALQKLGVRQIQRIQAAVAGFLEGEPKGGLTEVRFDLALVDGLGRIEILENALAA